jgi:hypothetical protein
VKGHLGRDKAARGPYFVPDRCRRDNKNAKSGRARPVAKIQLLIIGEEAFVEGTNGFEDFPPDQHRATAHVINRDGLP